MDIFEETVVTGFEESKEGKTRVGFGLGPGQIKLSSKEVAGYNLFKALEKYPEFTKEARSNLQEEFIEFTELSVLNLETFSAVLAFLKLYPEPIPKNFEKDILPYFTRILPNKIATLDERNRLIIRLKAQFIKYIKAINDFRAEEI